METVIIFICSADVWAFYMPYSLSNQIKWCKILQYASILLCGSKYWLWVQVKYKSDSSSVSVHTNAMSIPLYLPCLSSVPLSSYLQAVELEGEHWKGIGRPFQGDLVRWDWLKKQVSGGSWALPNVNVCSVRGVKNRRRTMGQSQSWY